MYYLHAIIYTICLLLSVNTFMANYPQEIAGTSIMANLPLGTGFAYSKIKKHSNEAADNPNFILILIDDMGWTDLGFMGSEYYETPNIDKLAKQGMKFTNAYANAANCAPTRACLLTGQYTPRHGVYTVASSERGNSKDRRLIPIENTTTLASDHITIAEVMQSAGYKSASIGKWHLGNPPTHGPVEQGFDVNVGGSKKGSPPGGYFAPYKNLYLSNGSDGEYLTDRLTDEALDFIDTNSTNPFFLYLTHYAVHTPVQAKSDIIDKYKTKIGSNGQDNPTYAAMVESVDQSVGRIMDKLDELQLAENTVVMFFSDNGGHASYTDMVPLRGSKGMFYEGGIREPMIARWLGEINPDTRCEVPVISTDFFPTILDIAGIEKPEDKVLDGESLLPLLKETGSLKRETIYWHFPAYLQKYTGGMDEARDQLFRTRPVSVVRKGDWKLLLFHEEWVLDGAREQIDTNNSVELYNLTQDISEANNVAIINKVKRDELLDDLLTWIESTGAPIPSEPNPDFGI